MSIEIPKELLDSGFESKLLAVLLYKLGVGQVHEITTQDLLDFVASGCVLHTHVHQNSIEVSVMSEADARKIQKVYEDTGVAKGYDKVIR